MPAISPASKVLVTGASGFLAVWVVQSLLKRGHTVRGTVRSTSKGEYLRKLFETDFPGKFEYVIVDDIVKPGAFDEAVKGVDAIAHTASPVVFLSPGIDPTVVIEPAVHGTTEILKSAAAHGPGVKRVVITSSGAALLEPHDGPYVYSERDWNDYSVKLVQEQGAAADGVHKYRASKTMAERVFWDFVKTAKFDGVTVNPPFIYGPILHDCNSLDQLNLSTKQLYDAFAQELSDDKLSAYAGQFLDVRDVAEAHADALEKDHLAGRRLVIGNGALAWQDFYDAAHSLPPETFAGLPFAIPKGKPGIADESRKQFISYSWESRDLLGWKFRPLPEVIRDTLLSLKAKGLF